LSCPPPPWSSPWVALSAGPTAASAVGLLGSSSASAQRPAQAKPNVAARAMNARREATRKSDMSIPRRNAANGVRCFAQIRRLFERVLQHADHKREEGK